MDEQARKLNNQRNIFLNRYFNLILSFLLIFLIFISYILLLGPKYNSAKVIISENISSQQMLYNQQQRRLDILKIIADLYGRISPAELTKFNSVLPYNYRQEMLFGEFEEIAEKNGWILKSVSLSDPYHFEAGQVATSLSEEDLFYGTANSNVGRINIDLTFTGVDYLGFKRLLSEFETNLRLYDITSVDFKGGNELQISLTTYFYKLPE